MRFKEFKPFLIEFANVGQTIPMDQLKIELDTIANAAKVLPPEADLEIKKIAFDFAQTKRQVDQFLSQLESKGKLEYETDDEEDESEEESEINQYQPEPEPVDVQPATQVPSNVNTSQEVPTPQDTTAEVPVQEPEEVEEPEDVEDEVVDTNIKENVEQGISGDNEYNEAVKAIESAKEEIEYIQSIKMPEAAKKRIIAQYQKTIETSTKLVQKYKSAVTELKLEKEKRKAAEKFSDDVFDILEKLANKVQGYVEISEEEYRGLNKTQKKIHDNAKTFASTFKTAFFGMILNMLRQNQEIDRNGITNFLNACYRGDVINMLGIINSGTGNVRDHVNPKYQDMLDLFASYGVFSWSPGRTSGAIGPGEMALSMMGNPAEKAKSGGDLVVNGINLEIKAGSTSGGRLNSKKILKGPAAWPVWRKGIEDIIKNNKSIPKDVTWSVKDSQGEVREVNKNNFTADTYNITGGKAKLGSRYNFNYQNLNKLNDEILIYSDPRKTFNLFYNTISTLITNLDEISRPSTGKKGKPILGPDGNPLFPGVDAANLIQKVINDDGTIDVNGMMAAYTKLAYESYHRADHVESIMFLNTSTLDYSIASNSQDLLSKMVGGKESTVRISGGFNFNDDQQSATPAYLATARSEKIIKR